MNKTTSKDVLIDDKPVTIIDGISYRATELFGGMFDKMATMIRSNLFVFIIAVVACVLLIVTSILLPVLLTENFPSDSLAMTPRPQGPIQSCRHLGIRRPDLVRAGYDCGKSIESVTEIDGIISETLKSTMDTSIMYDVDAGMQIPDTTQRDNAIKTTNANSDVQLTNTGEVNINDSIDKLGSVKAEVSKAASVTPVMNNNDAFSQYNTRSMTSPTGIRRVGAKEHLMVGTGRTIKGNIRYDPEALPFIYDMSDELEPFRAPSKRELVKSHKR